MLVSIVDLAVVVNLGVITKAYRDFNCRIKSFYYVSQKPLLLYVCQLLYFEVTIPSLRCHLLSAAIAKVKTSSIAMLV